MAILHFETVFADSEDATRRVSRRKTTSQAFRLIRGTLVSCNRLLGMRLLGMYFFIESGDAEVAYPGAIFTSRTMDDVTALVEGRIQVV